MEAQARRNYGQDLLVSAFFRWCPCVFDSFTGIFIAPVPVNGFRYFFQPIVVGNVAGQIVS